MWVSTLVAGGEANRSCRISSRTGETKQLCFTVLPRRRLAERPYPQAYPNGHKEPKRDLDIVC